jgi:hypothetical protein
MISSLSPVFPRPRRGVGAILLAVAIALVPGAPAGAQKQPMFFDDDPVARVVDTQDASKVQERELSLYYDALLNLFGRPGAKSVGRAANVNTIDQVPDSSWYTNRPAMTPEAIRRGVNDDQGPAPGTWAVSRKSNGVSPGFTIADTRGRRYFVKFDPPGDPELGTGAEAVVTRLFHALGYFVPQANVVTLRPEDLAIAEGATARVLGGGRRALHQGDIDEQLDRAHRNPDGTYRAIVTEALPGTPLGGFLYEGTRPDDPNDVVPHEDRRELRGLRVFSAWVNHTDAKAINSLDTLVTEDGRARVRHNLIDFNATLGSAGIGKRAPRDGYEYLAETGPMKKALPSFGFYVRPWMTIDYPSYRGVGRFESERFEPEHWRPRVPNPAYIRSRPDDTFWAARKLMALGDDVIRAAVQAGQYTDPAAEKFLADALIARRDKAGRAWLTAVNPIVDPALAADGTLTFENIAARYNFAAPASRYQAVWHRFDNATREVTRIGQTEAPSERIQAPAGLPAAPGSYVRVDISGAGGPNPSWAIPVHAYFKRTGAGWTFVGFERLPDAAAFRPGLVGAEPAAPAR